MKHLSIKSHIQNGFTLIEIMVVVVILSIFAGMIGLSVGSSDVRKNRGFYEHFVSSLGYIRLASAENMQPIGIRMTSNKQGQSIAQVVRLDNAYASYQKAEFSLKNSMELSEDIRNTPKNNNKPTWTVVDSITLPTPPEDVEIDVQSLEQDTSQRKLQPWFVGQDVPDILWYGTGQATAVNLEIKYKGRLIGDVIKVLPDGNVKVGQ